MGDKVSSRKAAQRGAPVYMYRFEYYSPVREGRLRAMHCMEIPFVFDNLEAVSARVVGGTVLDEQFEPTAEGVLLRPVEESGGQG